MPNAPGAPIAGPTCELVGRPAMVYRYRPLASEEHWQRLERIVVASRMYASPRADLNDPDDCIVRLAAACTFEEYRASDWAKRERRNFEESDPEFERHLARAYRLLASNDFSDGATTGMQRSVDSFGVLCFSPAPDMPGQWEEYASKSTGVCLAFVVQLEPALREKLVPVEYVDPLPTAHVFRDPSKVQVKKCLYTKAAKWEAEREWRALFPEQASTEIAFEPAALVEVVLGSRVTDLDEVRIEKMVAKRPVAVGVKRNG